MNKLLVRNDAKYRLLRTIIQGVIGTIIAYIDVILGFFTIPDELRPVIVAFVMAVLSPVMSALGTEQMDKPELEPDHWEGDDEQGE